MKWKPRKEIKLYYKKYGYKYPIWTWPWGPYYVRIVDGIERWIWRRSKNKVKNNIAKYAEKRFRQMVDQNGDELAYCLQWGFCGEKYGVRFYASEIDNYIKNTLQIDGYTKTIEEGFNDTWVIFKKIDKGA